MALMLQILSKHCQADMTQKASEVPQNSGVPTPEFRDPSQSSDTGPRTLGTPGMPVLKKKPFICPTSVNGQVKGFFFGKQNTVARQSKKTSRINLESWDANRNG